MFNAEEFMQSPTLDNLALLKKDDLFLLAGHLNLEVQSSMKKQKIKEVVVKYFVDSGIFEETFSDAMADPVGKVMEAYKARSLELEYQFKCEEMRMEKEKREFELKCQMEREERDHQIKMKELDLASVRTQPIPSQSFGSSQFDATKNIRLVPKFQEKEIDKYFLHFEKVACSLKWPKDVWTILLQSVLLGKAREIFSVMPVELSGDYDYVKERILKAYELVPEAYRQKFRNARKQADQTHVEFAREKTQMFDRWLRSKDIGHDIEKLRELGLMEEFKKCVHNDVKSHLDEHKVDTLNQAAIMADDYSLTHKLSAKVNYNTPVSSQASHVTASSINKSTKSGQVDKSVNQTNNVHQSTESPVRIVTCAYCKKKGHIMSDCWSLKKKEERKAKGVQPNACTAVIPKRKTAKAMSLDKHCPTKSKSVMDKMKQFLSQGYVSPEGEDNNRIPITILRDTGSCQSLFLESALPVSEKTYMGADVLVQGVGSGFIPAPLHQVYLESDLVSGLVQVGVLPTLPMEGVSLLLGNDLAGDKVIVNPIVTNQPVSECTENVFVQPTGICTRAMSAKMLENEDETSVAESSPTHSKETCNGKSSKLEEHGSLNKDVLSREHLIYEQNRDPELLSLRDKSLSGEERDKVPVCYFEKDGVLMRKWRPPDVGVEDEWEVVYQIVVPKVYREQVMSIGHDSPMAGHLGVTKTYNRVLTHFFWPKMKSDVAQYCRSCHICQVVGKPNQKIPCAPLQPIPACDEPFSQVIIDCVGPLPKTRSGNEYLLTVMCASTRFPEAIPLRNIKATTIVSALTKFFTLVGLPKSIQSDQGSNFMSTVFQQVLYQLGIQQFKSSAYHPESQGALERFHQTLKNMIRTYCLEYEKDWDTGIHMLLFSARESVQESLGYSPFELVFGRKVRGPLKLLKEKWLEESTDTNLLEYVTNFKQKLVRAREIASTNLKASQRKMKTWYDKNARSRVFEPGEMVLVLLPVPGHSLQARYHGPYEVECRVGELDYVVKTPGRRKTKQLCHINMLKKYVGRDDPMNTKSVPCAIVNPEVVENSIDDQDIEPDDRDCSVRLRNSDVLSNLDTKLEHLTVGQREEMKGLINENIHLFPDVPNKTTVLFHDVDVGEATPIKQHPYRLNPVKAKIMSDEIQYMLDNDIIEPSQSEWSSPCLLVPKPDKSFRFCTDFRKVNAVTKTDSFPMKRLQDCIDKVGSAKYVTKFDLLKGYWQVPLTERAKNVSAFVTPTGLYQYKVMPFGMRNAPATFQRLMNKMIANLEGTECYIDDVVIYSDTWEQHVKQVSAFMERMSEANLTINLVKSELCCATVQYLGHTVGLGQVKPVQAKVEAIDKFPIPSNRKEVMRFLGMAGFYRNFCPNFSTVAYPLTNLLQKNVKFKWNAECQVSFEKIKAILTNKPVLVAPDFEKPFTIVVDACDIGVGAALTQNVDDFDHPVSYFSKKLNKHQRNYSTVEKECLGLVLAVQHFELYVGGSACPITILTDHNPLTFLQRVKYKNQRLLRWALNLQEFNLDVKHVKGINNKVADALSRAGI
ncbi:uncharacterized protein LOC117343335 [Pecten maximus]|uniref:uncharacterized protein LOC117343335 n=1 Tax=Pecten maximus TaxID=6579 RepID=UPI00145810B6|nr:uncharacterized protein LOC117343335 [Pecten maximus]